ncbi:uncharacterized protein LOC121933435 [Sceloporus undulatus]|uniref:uncharacterized protein LOC121933435 n=1 Tax=Sceloporus undulatus TaxID=8520 RepID=UPI001C4AD8A6|nr:uncharacterized protein LOC121933435 [Sceloporus undulatus]
MASFKQCTKCGVKIPRADDHDKCVLCLGEAHIQGSCAHCKAMSAQALKNRDRTLKAALYERVLSQPGGSGASGEADAPKAPKRKGEKRSDRDKKRARSTSPPAKSRRKGPPSTVSVPPPESRPVPSTSPVPEPVKTPTPSLPALSRTVPLEPRVLLTSHLSVPADSLQIVNVDSASEGELQDSYAPFSPQRPRSRSPSPSPTRRPRSASRDWATLGTEADEALAAHHRPPADHDRDLFQAFPDLVHDQRTGQYLIPVDPSRLRRDLRAHLQGRRPDDDTSRRDDRDNLGTSDSLFRRRSPSPSRSGSGSPRSASPVSDEDTPFVPQGPSVPSPTDDVRAFADRVIQMADTLKLEVAHPEDDALDPVERRIHSSAPAPPALAYLPSLEKIAKRSWDAPATIPSTSRRIENLYRVTPSTPSWLSNHPKLNSAIVEGAQSTFAPKASSSPVDKDSKKLDALAKKFYASAALDLKIANYAACMGAYVQSLVKKMDPTIADLPEDRRRMMAALRNEIHLMAGQQIISARHSTDCASKILSGSIALRRYMWVRSSDLTPQAKAAIEDMPFDNSGLFNRDTDEKLSFRYRMKTAARKHGRLLVRDARLERCLLSHSDPGGPPQVPRLRCWIPGVSVQGPSLWPFHSSKSLHEVHGTRGGLPTSEGNHSLPVPGRLALRSILKGRPAQAAGFCPIPATSTRTTGQLRQVQPDSYQANRLHRINTGLCTDEGVPSRDKVPSPLCISAALPPPKTPSGPCSSSRHGAPGLHHFRHTVGQTAPQAHSILVPLRVRPRPRHGYQVAHHPENGTEVLTMVAPIRQRLCGDAISTPSARPLPDYGRLPARMGRPHIGPYNKGQTRT